MNTLLNINATVDMTMQNTIVIDRLWTLDLDRVLT